MSRLGLHLSPKDNTPEVHRALNALEALDDDTRERVCATAMGRSRLRDWHKGKKQDKTEYDLPRRFPGDDHSDDWKDNSHCYHVSQPYHLFKDTIVELARIIETEGIDITVSAQGSWYNPGRTLDVVFKRPLCSRPWGPAGEVGPPTSLEIMNQAIKEVK